MTADREKQPRESPRAAAPAAGSTPNSLDAILRVLPMLLLAFDERGRVTFVAGRSLSGASARLPSLRGAVLPAAYADSPQIRDAIERCLGGEPVTVVAFVDDRWWEVRGEPVFADERPAGGVAVALDVTEQVRAAEALRANERWLRGLLENLREIISVHDRRGTITYVSPGITRLTGRTPEELVGSGLIGFVHPEDRDLLLAAFDAWESGKSGEPVEYRASGADGRWHRLESTGVSRLDDPAIGGVVVITRDVTEARSIEAQLRHQALHDPLTGLPNRALLRDRLDGALARARRHGGLLAVLMIDLDRFQVVNESLGHAAGDEVIRTAANLLAAVLRPTDTVARVGGDEFVLCCEDVPDPSAVIAIAERVQQLLGVPFRVAGQELHLASSIGIVATTGQADDTPESLLRNADAALFRAKERGRGRYELFDEATRLRAVHRLRLESALRRATRLRQFEVHYQPTLALADGSVRGVEALVRWRHNDALMPPDRFIPLAEETALVVDIGAFVLETACAQAVAWQRELPEPPGTVAVNLSARELAESHLVARVVRVLESTGLAPERLLLEITESVLMDDVEQALSVLNRLRSLGVQIAVDDFGTGYSSLVYLRRLPVDVLKIDKAFVRGIGSDRTDETIAGTVVSLAHALGVRAVAEGVERSEQARTLATLGCDLGQGYLWTRPLPAAEADRWLRSHSLAE